MPVRFWGFHIRFVVTSKSREEALLVAAEIARAVALNETDGINVLISEIRWSDSRPIVVWLVQRYGEDMSGDATRARDDYDRLLKLCRDRLRTRGDLARFEK